MAYTKQIVYDLARTFASGSVTSSYQALGTALSFPSSIVKIVNNSTQDISVSIDGTNLHDYVPAGSFTLYDLTTNTPSQGDDAVFDPKGTQYYIMGTAGTGNIYLIVRYIKQV